GRFGQIEGASILNGPCNSENGVLPICTYYAHNGLFQIVVMLDANRSVHLTVIMRTYVTVRKIPIHQPVSHTSFFKSPPHTDVSLLNPVDIRVTFGNHICKIVRFLFAFRQIRRIPFIGFCGRRYRAQGCGFQSNKATGLS
ncbi:hypothetical protein CBL_20307, partial [Carabus blaptoides fortunei]